MLQAQLCVTYAALTLGTICFIIFVVTALVTLLKKPPADTALTEIARAAAPTTESASITDFKDLVEALAKLSDSLAKAGPALTSLIGAVLFYVIAAIGSGALQSGPPAASKAATDAVSDKGEQPVPEAKLPPPS